MPVLLFTALLLSSGPTVARPVLRVCADPNNLPFSNRRQEGFENKLAELLARELGAELQYTWFPQRRGFLRNTLNAKRCDLVMGVPVGLDRVAITQPYYRSRYVFVYGPHSPHVTSLDDPRLRTLRIGVPLVGENGNNPPPWQALALRGLAGNAKGYLVTGNYLDDSPPAELIRAVSRGEVDLAIAWGPMAGYFAGRANPPLMIVPVPLSEAPAGESFAFPIAMGVRADDLARAAELSAILEKRKADIDALLDSYGVPRL